MSKCPKDWHYVSLGDHIDLLTGFPFSSEEFVDTPESIRLIRGVNIGQGFLKWEDTAYWSTYEIDKYQVYELIVGDLVLAMDRTWVSAGIKFAWIKESEIPSLLVQRVARIRGKQHLSTYYIRHLFASYTFSTYIQKFTTGTNVPHISPTDIKEFTFCLPPIIEQRKIAEMLSTWDEAIAKTECLIAALRERKKGLTQRLLTGQVRFAGFDKAWRETELSEFFYSYSKKNAANEDLTILSCSTVHGIVQQSVIFGKRIASEDIRRYKVVERGDLIFDPMLLWDASIGFLEVVDRGVISPAYTTLKFKKNSGNQLYFKYLLKTHYYRQHYKFISQGTNVRRKKAPVEAFLKLPVWLPATIEEQNKIVAVLQESDKEIDLHVRKLEALKQQKKGLMQRLLTGEIRVHV